MSTSNRRRPYRGPLVVTRRAPLTQHDAVSDPHLALVVALETIADITVLALDPIYPVVTTSQPSEHSAARDLITLASAVATAAFRFRAELKDAQQREDELFPF